MVVKNVLVDGQWVVVELDDGDWIEFPDKRSGILDIRAGGEDDIGGYEWFPTRELLQKIVKEALQVAKEKGLDYAVEVLEQY